jgi:hypothetical protein
MIYMKFLIIGLITVFSLSTFAKEIEGTMVLKGTLRTKLLINSVNTTCRVKVSKVKNMMAEDSYGNPAYQVRMSISLDGSDFARGLKIKHSKEMDFINLFQVGKTREVRDYEYVSADGSKLIINNKGRINTVTFPFNSQMITCSF